MILHNSDSSVHKKYLPIIEANCLKGEAEWESFAMMTDKLQVLRHRPQLYGTQRVINAMDPDKKLYMVDDLRTVNERRKRIGLHSIQY